MTDKKVTELATRNCIDVGTKNRPINIGAKTAVMLYEVGRGGKYIVTYSISVAILLASSMVTVDGRLKMGDKVTIEATREGRRAQQRMRKSIW